MRILKDLDFAKLPDGSFLMIAEGNAEAGFLFRYGVRHNVANAFIANVQGEKNLATALKSLHPFRHKLKALGLMFDANQDASARLQGIEQILTNNGFTYAIADADENGICSSDFAIGIFLSPGDGGGRIEDMILQELKTKDFWQCLSDWKVCAEHCHSIAEIDEKAIVQMAISAMDGEVCGVGVAFKRELLDVDHAAYGSICSMISALGN